MSKLMTLKRANEILEEMDWYYQHISETRAEAGMGAMSMGYGVDGAYAAASEATADILPPFTKSEIDEATKVSRMFYIDLELMGVDDLMYNRIPYNSIPEYHPHGTTDPEHDLPF